MSQNKYRKPVNGGVRGQAPMPMKLDLSNVDGFKCGAETEKPTGQEALFDPFCGGEHFEPVYGLKVVSELISPTGHRMLAMPAPGENDWRCVKCGKIYSMREILGV